MSEHKTMSVRAFREHGYLQEVNRRFLHPLGLALEVIVEDDGSERFGEVWDSREDPEGFTYGPNMIDAEKASRIQLEGSRKEAVRFAKFDWNIQPY